MERTPLTDFKSHAVALVLAVGDAANSRSLRPGVHLILPFACSDPLSDLLFFPPRRVDFALSVLSDSCLRHGVIVALAANMTSATDRTVMVEKCHVRDQVQSHQPGQILLRSLSDSQTWLPNISHWTNKDTGVLDFKMDRVRCANSCLVW